MPDLLLEMKNIHKQFDGNYVLKGANFTLYKGEVHAVVGENGAGKSTLMNILAGIYPMDSGEIVVEGKEVRIENAKHAQKLGIGTIFQNFNLFYDMNIAENIFLNQEPAINLGFCKIINWRKAYKKSREVLDYLNIKIDPTLPVRSLDYGSQKMVEIARTIVSKSRLIIMDEPTAALTEKEVEFLFEIINNLKQMDVSVIYISHRLEEITHIADRITIMRDGKDVGTINKQEIDLFRLTKMIIGDGIKDRYPKLNLKTGKDLMIVNKLCSTKKLQNISFSVRRGEILGIAGLKGAGKSTLCKALFGVEPITSGNIYINGRKVEIKSVNDAVKNGICYVTPNRMEEGLIAQMDAYNNITSTNLRRISKWGLIRENIKTSEAKKYIDMLGIKIKQPFCNVEYLSGGAQKKVILAKWLFNNSKVLILNEPTSSIDVSSKVDVYNILNELVRSGAALIFVSSEIPELLGMCDRILIMYKGRIVKELDRSEASREKILYYASGELL
jgi:ribose transport system ATP-binding protein